MERPSVASSLNLNLSTSPPSGNISPTSPVSPFSSVNVKASPHLIHIHEHSCVGTNVLSAPQQLLSELLQTPSERSETFQQVT